MSNFDRRNFLKKGAMGAAALAFVPSATSWASPFVHTSGDLLFRPYPHPMMPTLDHAYLTDTNGDPIYKSELPVSEAGIAVDDAWRESAFGVNAQWYIEGFGYVWLEADNGGRYYSADDFMSGQRTLNLNREFAGTRVSRNRELLERYDDTRFSSEVRNLHALSQELYEDATKAESERAGALANSSLEYGLWAAEKIELEKARADIARQQRARDFYFGCETRQYIWGKSVDTVDRFVEAFDFATVTHYVYDTWYPMFEPVRGEHRWGIKDEIVGWLTDHEITVEGRPLFWFHPWVTPDWIKDMSFGELKGYVEDHVEACVSHYGDRVHSWEVVNEYHDWANIHNHTPEQITEITRLAMEKTHEVNPDISRLVNNCCPFGDYVASGMTASGEATRPIRTPWQYVRDLVEADVPFDVTGVQMYYPGRDLSSIVRLVERFAQFGKPIYITEIGASSGKADDNPALYDWHRPWDEDLQADWLEQLYTILYSKPYVHALNWYDFVDFRTFIPNGGLVQVDGTPKASYERLQELLAEWKELPEEATTYGPVDERVEWSRELME